jgi:hypothetical protein
MAVTVCAVWRRSKTTENGSQCEIVCWLWCDSPDFEAVRVAPSHRNPLLLLSDLASEGKGLILKKLGFFFQIRTMQYYFA